VSQLNDGLKTNGTTLDINTEKGQANLQIIQSAVSAAHAHAQAIAQQTGSTQQATDAYNAEIATLKDQVTATGAAKDKIDAYVDSIDKIPPLKQTQLDIIAAVQVTAANLGQSVHDVINGVGTTPVPKKHAAGGFLSEGWNTAVEPVAGPEWLYKQGSQVQVFNRGQMAAMPKSGSTIIQYISTPADPVAAANAAARRLESVMV
jgi:hypothetical protein